MTDPTDVAHPAEEKKEEAISAAKQTPKKSIEPLKKDDKDGEVFTLQALRSADPTNECFFCSLAAGLLHACHLDVASPRFALE
jgi:hypothetical protein